VWQNLCAVTHILLFVFSAALIATESVAPVQPPVPERAGLQSTASAQRRLTSPIAVTLPADDAVLMVNDAEIPGAGAFREFASAPLDAGTHQYTFAVTWEPNSYTTITRSKTVAFRAGELVRVDLTVEDPADRVRVIYVPTPVDVAAAMVELAGVGGDDVVYEPGCGDARITVAAIRAGARRGICVDIDPERARESKSNVEAAGFATRIDVREGDALDVKDLSDVSVVFLYMGDHFDLLIRPVLWRELKVGSRIVSHRFTMGDWPPDRTVSVTSDLGLDYELHLWTITEDIKRRQGIR
jgi:uncharacterized protein (TIGR03000 family)